MSTPQPAALVFSSPESSDGEHRVVGSEQQRQTRQDITTESPSSEAASSSVRSARSPESARRSRPFPVAVELPVEFQKVVNYFIDQSPPGQLPRVIESCRACLLVALSTVDSPSFLAAVESFVQKALLSHAELFAEENLSVIPLMGNERLVPTGAVEQCLPPQKQLPPSCVICKGNRVEGTTWYLCTEPQIFIQVDPVEGKFRRFVDVSQAPPECRVKVPDLSHPQRLEIEAVLRGEYIPRHFRLGAALSVHFASNSFFAAERPVEPEPGSRVLQIVIAAEKVNLANFWGGSWKSLWEVDLGNSEAEKTTIKGRIQVRLQYTEDGSIYQRQSRYLERELCLSKGDPQVLARDVIGIIAEEEKKLHEGLLKFYLVLHTDVLRTLQRLVPLSGGKFSWSSTGTQGMLQEIEAAQAFKNRA